MGGEFSSGLCEKLAPHSGGRCSGEVWTCGIEIRKEEEMEICTRESYLQMVVEDIGVDESVRGKNREEARGGESREKAGDNRLRLTEAITEQAAYIYPPKSDGSQPIGKYPRSCTKSLW